MFLATFVCGAGAAAAEAAQMAKAATWSRENEKRFCIIGQMSEPLDTGSYTKLNKESQTMITVPWPIQKKKEQ